VGNALKHSRAKQIRIRLANAGDRLTLSVNDNGRGGARTQANDTGMGLRVMKYRADLIGASLEVDSAPRRGTRVTCIVAKSL
jgi:signal transduction histidine kinase